jgi:hypothetical protein
MKKSSLGWFRLIAVAALLASACGSANSSATTSVAPSTRVATPSASPTTPAASPNPTPTTLSSLCPQPSNRCLALVTLRGSYTIVVRDITDISHPKTVSNLGGISVPAFVSATEISYAGDIGFVRAPLAGSPVSLLATSQGFISYAFAWSPDGTTLVYLTQGNSGMALHQLTAGVDRVLDGSLPSIPIVGCESQFCSLTDSSDIALSYSPDGTTISMVASVANLSAFRLWASDGRLLKKSDSRSPLMPAWSDGSLYFRDANGVEVWRSGVTSSFLPGVVWIRPKASPAGGQIVYEIRDAQGWAHTLVVDTGSGKVRELKQARSEPVFLTSRYIWYKGERACVASDHCPPGWSVVASGKTYIYDLQDGMETESIIASVSDVWPHAA